MQNKIFINELSDLRAHEQEIVERINSNRLIAQLFAFAPVQALTEVNVQIGEKALAQWVKLVPSLAHAGKIGLVQYKKLKAIKGANGIKVTVRGILPPLGLNVQQEDDAELRNLRGSSTLMPEY